MTTIRRIMQRSYRRRNGILVPTSILGSELGWWLRADLGITQIANHFTRESELDHSDWTKDGSTVTPNDTTDPDGGTTADLLTEVADTGFHAVMQVPGHQAVGSTTISFYAKQPASDAQRWVFVSDGFASVCFFDLQTGSLGTETACTGTITDVGNGWFLCEMAYTSTASVTVTIGMSPSNGTQSYTVSGGSELGVYFYKLTLDQKLVSAYADQSGNGLDFVQATVADMVKWNEADADLDGQASIEFGVGNTHMLELADATALGDVDNSTWIFVLKPDSTTTNQILLRNAADGVLYYESGAANAYGIFDGFAHRTNGVVPTTVAQILEWEFNAATGKCQCRVDNVLSGPALDYDGTLDLDKVSAVTLGGWGHDVNQLFLGSKAEMIVAKKVMTSQERSGLYGSYLGGRYPSL